MFSLVHWCDFWGVIQVTKILFYLKLFLSFVHFAPSSDWWTYPPNFHYCFKNKYQLAKVLNIIGLCDNCEYLNLLFHFCNWTQNRFIWGFEMHFKLYYQEMIYHAILPWIKIDSNFWEYTGVKFSKWHLVKRFLNGKSIRLFCAKASTAGLHCDFNPSSRKFLILAGIFFENGSVVIYLNLSKYIEKQQIFWSNRIGCLFFSQSQLFIVLKTLLSKI